MAFEVENLAFRAERRGHINQPILTGREWCDNIRGTVEKTAGRRTDLGSMVSFVENAECIAFRRVAHDGVEMMAKPCATS